MLERYFVKYQTVDRIRGCWLGTAIERYVEWLEQEGYAQRNVFRRVPLLCHFAQFAEERGAASLEQATTLVEDFAEHWMNGHARDGMSLAARHKLAEEARNPVNQLLHLQLPDYAGGGRHVRPDPFRDVATLAAFVVESAPALSRNARRDLCSTMKVFLRYCHRERLIAVDLSAAVEMPQAYRLAELPRSISWDEVRQMFAVVDRRSPKGIRDYAILLLLVTYGLRAHEVAALTLDDLDWSRDRLCVPERKAGHWSVYPLANVVGEVLVAYLQQVRPTTTDRHLFFRLLAPVKPLSSTAIAQSVGGYLHKAGINVRRAGSHTLRHTCVQRLVDADVSLKVIGDYVGHRSPSSTAIYAKVAPEALREVALGDGEAL